MENDVVIPSKPISKNFKVSFPKYPQNSILTLLGHDCLCILYPGPCQFHTKSINQKPEYIFFQNFAHIMSHFAHKFESDNK